MQRFRTRRSRCLGFTPRQKSFLIREQAQSRSKESSWTALRQRAGLDREDEPRKEAKRKRDNKSKDAAGFAHPSDQKAMDAIAAKEEAEQLAKRKKLVLPLPQVSNSELETTAKLGQQGALSKELVGGTDGGALSDTLLGNYSETPSTTVARASRTPAQLDCLTNKETSGAMPHGDSAATPNPFATSFRPSAQGGASGANGSGKDPSAVRDELGLNTSAQEIGATPRERKVDQSWIAQAK